MQEVLTYKQYAEVCGITLVATRNRWKAVFGEGGKFSQHEQCPEQFLAAYPVGSGRTKRATANKNGARLNDYAPARVLAHSGAQNEAPAQNFEPVNSAYIQPSLFTVPAQVAPVVPQSEAVAQTLPTENNEGAKEEPRANFDKANLLRLANFVESTFAFVGAFLQFGFEGLIPMVAAQSFYWYTVLELKESWNDERRGISLFVCACLSIWFGYIHLQTFEILRPGAYWNNFTWAAIISVIGWLSLQKTLPRDAE